MRKVKRPYVWVVEELRPRGKWIPADSFLNKEEAVRICREEREFYLTGNFRVAKYERVEP